MNVSKPVTRQDIEAKLRELQARVEDEAEQAKPSIIRVGAAVAAGVIVLVYLMGKRRGRIRSTVVEVRRV